MMMDQQIKSMVKLKSICHGDNISNALWKKNKNYIAVVALTLSRVKI